MIHSVMILNTQGYARLLKFYENNYPPDVTKELVRGVFELIHYREPAQCQFVETDIIEKANKRCHRSTDQDDHLLLMYRQYATLYVVFLVDQGENELAILDLIQVFVEAMDRCFDAVCELDIIFNMHKIHLILNEIIVGGLVLETNIEEIIERYEDQNRLESESNKELQGAKMMAKLRHQIDLEGKVKKIQKNLKRNTTKI